MTPARTPPSQVRKYASEFRPYAPSRAPGSSPASSNVRAIRLAPRSSAAYVHARWPKRSAILSGCRSAERRSAAPMLSCRTASIAPPSIRRATIPRGRAVYGSMTALVTEAPLEAFLAAAPLIEVDAPEIGAFVATQLNGLYEADAARTVFLFVRDEVHHSWDVQGRRVTRSAVDTLTHREGICYAKSHLAAALLRRAGLPAGICYQRLTLFDDASGGHAVHALNTVYLGSL